MKELHIILPDSLAESLDRLASRLDETRNGLIRRALQEFIDSERKRELASEMTEYVVRMAKQSGEFVKESQRVVSRKVLRETRW